MADDKKNINSKTKISRRDVLKSISTFPLLGILSYDFWKKKTKDEIKTKVFNVNLSLDDKDFTQAPEVVKNSRQILKIGIIGVGSRAIALLKALGFLDPLRYESILKTSKTPEKAKVRLQSFFNQDMLNVHVVAVCDVFDLHADKGERIVSKGIQPNGEPVGIKGVKKYRRYQDLLANKEIDAVIVATPDFHHAEITIAAVKAGKHVYCEKAMTRTEEELHEVYKTVKNSNLVFQLGHQLSKSESYKRAREVINKNILGKVTLIETTTNRNTPSGAWIRHLDSKGNLKPGSPKTIDWDLWLGPAPYRPYNPQYLPAKWRRWWDFGCGRLGDMACHIMDPAFWALDLKAPYSVEAHPQRFTEEIVPESTEVRWEFEGRKDQPPLTITWYDGLSRPFLPKEVNQGFELPSQGGLYYGDKGVLLIPRRLLRTPPDKDLPTLLPVGNMEDVKPPEQLFERNLDHYQEWIKACKEGTLPSTNFDYSGPLTETVLLGNVAAKAGKRILWDSKNFNVTNMPEANKYLKREYREGWSL